MEEVFEYVGVLRCCTWHVWPAVSVFEQRQIYFYDGAEAHPARIAVLSYEPRTSPELYPDEPANKGILLWDGKVPGLLTVRNEILKAPEDVVPVEFRHRHAYLGEVDICINFRLKALIAPGIVEAVRTVVYSAMSALNLELDDFLAPALPFQISRVVKEGGRQMGNTVTMAVRNRSVLDETHVQPVLDRFAKVVRDENLGKRMLVALELYAAHFNETQARVRFLLLVIAMEAIAEETPKHATALTVLDKWQQELSQQLSELDSESDAHHALEALRKELKHKKVDSIRSQIRNLFRDAGDSDEESKGLQKRALKVYDKRSTLVHKGYLPSNELEILETEARTLLELLFKNAIEAIDKTDE